MLLGDDRRTSTVDSKLSDLSYLANLEDAGAAYYAHRCYAAAEICYLQIVSIKADHGVTDECLVSALHRLGVLHRLQENYNEAEEFYNGAIKIAVHLFGQNHPKVLEQKAYLAGLCHQIGRYDQALRIILSALSTYEAVEGSESPIVALYHFALAFVYLKMHEPIEALSHAESAKYILSTQIYGSDETVLHALLDMAMYYFELQNVETAEVLFTSACLMTEESLWQCHPIVPLTLLQLGLFYEAQREVCKAELCYEAALSKLRAAFGDDHSNVREAMKQLVKYHVRQGNTAKVREYERRLWELDKQTVAMTVELMQAA